MMLEEKLKQLQERIKQYPLTSLIILLSVLLFLLVVIPYLQVDYRGINNATEEATLENQYRATLAQVLGGVAIGIGLYYTWRRINIAEDSLKVTQENLEATQKVAQENLKVVQEGQITERFTRAIDQLGNKKIEIRLGGIYALERISKESDKDYWPIMEVLTAYVRNHSGIDSSSNEKTQTIESVPSDIQAILTVLGRRKYNYNNEESKRLNLSKIYLNGVELIETNLKGINFSSSNLEGANFEGAHLEEADLRYVHSNCRTNLIFAHLEGANLRWAHFEGTYLNEANFEGANLDDTDFTGARLRLAHFEKTVHKRSHFVMADLEEAHLEGANLTGAILEGTNLKRAHLEGANLTGAFFNNWTKLEETHLEGANLTGAILEGANLKGAQGLTIDQLSKAKTLYDAELDEELLIPLKEKYPALFEKPDE